jgi:hypothetical protein
MGGAGVALAALRKSLEASRETLESHHTYKQQQRRKQCLDLRNNNLP